MDRLIEKIIETKNPTVAGLDPKMEYIPEFIRERSFAKCGTNLEGAADAIWEFNQGLIDALCDVVPAVKPQSAYYEMYGVPGLVAMNRTIRYAKEKGMYVILDVKRNDIGSTAEAYSRAYLGTVEIGGKTVRAFDPDGITINPYLGTDGIQPFLFDANTNGKSVFALVKTSNPSSGEFQDLPTENGTLYERVAEKIGELSLQALGTHGYSKLGCVIGATYPEQAKKLREMLPYCFFLVPGYGAQGGKAEDVAVSFDRDGLGAIVNSSRGIMCAYKKGAWTPEQYGEAARAEAIRMRNDIVRALEYRRNF